MGAKISDAINLVNEQYNMGVDSVLILTDLLEITHFITRVKISPNSLTTLPLIPKEQERIKDLANKLSISVLARVWQMLLKGLDEIKKVPNLLSAIEMILIRISYIGMMPGPAEILEKIENQNSSELQKKNS